MMRLGPLIPWLKCLLTRHRWSVVISDRYPPLCYAVCVHCHSVWDVVPELVN